MTTIEKFGLTFMILVAAVPTIENTTGGTQLFMYAAFIVPEVMFILGGNNAHN